MDHNFSLNYRCLACIEHDIIGLQASHTQKTDESEYNLPKTALVFLIQKMTATGDSLSGGPRALWIFICARGPFDQSFCLRFCSV